MGFRRKSVDFFSNLYPNIAIKVVLTQQVI